jgi:hypothetical protein
MMLCRFGAELAIQLFCFMVCRFAGLIGYQPSSTRLLQMPWSGL